jgi:hypothetical protein
VPALGGGPIASVQLGLRRLSCLKLGHSSLAVPIVWIVEF